MEDITLTLTREEFSDILSALDYTSEDYSYRADFEERHGADEDDEERSDYEDAADKYGALRTTLMKRVSRCAVCGVPERIHSESLSTVVQQSPHAFEPESLS